MAEDWEIVTVVESEEEAQLVAGYLQSRGVDCQVDSSHSSEFPATVGALGVVRLEVPVAQADEARRLLGDRERDGALPAEVMVDEGPEGVMPDGVTEDAGERP
jgi:hypothetical protein